MKSKNNPRCGKETTMKKNLLIAVLLILVGGGGAFMYLKFTGKGKDNGPPDTAEFCARHKIAEKDCPWCDPTLIETKGQCAGHRVPEALCSRCNPDLIPGFKAENDWCAGHSVPESQCDLCKGGDLPPGETR
jgi:hypothetical protein